MQSDNTVKEIRNQYGCKMLACMSQAGLWGVASCHHLQVGHTHEDIDAVFSLIAVALRTCQSQCMQTPMDVVKRIESKIGHLWTKKGLHFSIELVDTVTRIRFEVWNWNIFFHHLTMFTFLELADSVCSPILSSKVRDWVAILPAGVTFKNAFRARKWAGNEDQAPLPQSFSFMPRAGKV